MSKGKLDGEGEQEKKSGKVVAMPGKRGAAKSDGATKTRRKEDAEDDGSYKGAKKALRHAVKAEVKKKSVEFARKLVDKATSGDTRGAEMVLSLINNKKLEDDPKKKKRSGPSWAELLASEPEWDESTDDGGQGKKTG